MPILETKHKRKSAAITTIILLILLFVIFNYGMTYLDPPEEYGLAINYGDSNVGIGEPVERTKRVSTPKVVEKEEVVQEEVVQEEVVQEFIETPKEIIKEEIITDDTVKEVPVVEKKEEKKTPVKEVVQKEIPKEKPKPTPKPTPKPKPKPSKETQDALNNLLNGNSSDGKAKGEGDDKKEGVKGNEKGDPDSNKYYGNTGSGSGGNYNLAGRKALSKPIEQPDCQEEGIVVVRITVDKNGKVISAIPGVKGSNNTAACLLKPAKEAALRTTWNADDKAPVNQTGTIIYKFSLTK
jgi:protein TonB